MPTYEGGFSGRPVKLRLDVAQGNQSVDGNWSALHWTLYAIKTGNTTAFNNNPANWTVDINGAVWSGNFTYNFDGPVGQAIVLASISTAYSHNADGTMSLYITAAAHDPSGFLGDAYIGPHTYVLTTIPRATLGVFATPGNAIAGVAKTLNLPRASSSFTHTVHYSFGSSGWVLVGTGLGTSVNITFPLSLLSNIPNAVVGSGTIRVTTYNGSTWIGARDSVFYLEAPASVVPDFTNVTFVEATAGLAANVGKFVQHISKLTPTVNGATAPYSATVASRKVLVDNQTVDSGQTTPNVITTSGATVPVVTTVTDSRGRTKVKNSTIEVLPYAPPVLNAPITVQRSTSGGTVDDQGTYLRVNVNATVQSLMNSTQRNTMFIKTYVRPRSGAAWDAGQKATYLKESYQVPSSAVTFNSYRNLGTYSIQNPYDVLVEVSDEFSTSAVQLIVPTASIFMHWDSNEGLGIGKYRANGMLDVLGQGYQNDGQKIVDEARAASNLEIVSGTDITKYVTPAGLKYLNDKRGGLVKVIPTGLGTAHTIDTNGDVLFSATDALVMDGIFTTLYSRYKLVIDIDATTASSSIFANLRVAGVANISSNYFYSRNYNANNVATSVTSVSQTRFEVVGGTHVISAAGVHYIVMELVAPVGTKRLRFTGQAITFGSAVQAVVADLGGYFNIANSFDGIQFHPTAGSISGRAAVYGYA